MLTQNLVTQKCITIDFSSNLSSEIYTIFIFCNLISTYSITLGFYDILEFGLR